VALEGGMANDLQGASVDKENGERLFPMDKTDGVFHLRSKFYITFIRTLTCICLRLLSAPPWKELAEAVRRSSVLELRAHAKGMGTCVFISCMQESIGGSYVVPALTEPIASSGRSISPFFDGQKGLGANGNL
jgi:hypothetical protein